MKKPNTFQQRPTFEKDGEKATEFLKTYQDRSMQIDEIHGKYKYMRDLQAIANNQSKRLEILIEDLEDFFMGDEKKLIENITSNTMMYIRVFLKAANKLMPDPTIDNEQEEDLQYKQRQMNLERHATEQKFQGKSYGLPEQLKKKYDLYFIRGGQTKENILSVRQLHADRIGSLVIVRAMVVRISDVKPQIITACYSCDSCGYEIYQIVSGKQFTPLSECPSTNCQQNKIRGKLIFNHALSEFKPYQEIKIQELTEQLPQGAIPRVFTVVLKGESNIRTCTPGDRVTLQGVFLPQQKEGFMSHSSLVFNTYIEAFKVSRDKKKYTEVDLNSQTALDVLEEFNRLEFPEFYSRICKSIAPEIYGMEDVKKALLLMMITGVTKEMHDGMRIRGDINVALIGDPGVAKSQLLKFITTASPRAIYTTGKGSSSVGLTAAVIRDEITNEMTLEGGALVMADMGICCIDEFDKMNESDRTAIHEVMEQQTVSIAKAGITTTLNARTAILAAANPLYGRYNKNISPHQNINLPAALLSRFDLIFILLDLSDPTQDELMARHIGYVHQNLQAPKTTFQPFSIEFIKTYIAMAKQYEPVVTSGLHEFIAEKYVSKRQETSEKAMEGYSYTTPRTLLAVIRLSQALAKCRFSKEVSQDDVDEALRLMEVSQETVKLAKNNDVEKKPQLDVKTQIFCIVKEMCGGNASRTRIDNLEKKVLLKGFTSTQLQECLELYKSLNVIMITKTHVNLVA